MHYLAAFTKFPLPHQILVKGVKLDHLFWGFYCAKVRLSCGTLVSMCCAHFQKKMDYYKALIASIFVANCVTALASEAPGFGRFDVAWQNTALQHFDAVDPSEVSFVEGALLQGAVPSDNLVYPDESSFSASPESQPIFLIQNQVDVPALPAGVDGIEPIYIDSERVDWIDGGTPGFADDSAINIELPTGNTPNDIEVCPLPDPFVNETPLFNEKMITFKNRLAYTRDSLGRGYISMSEKLDRFFAGRSYDGLGENESRFGIEMANTWFETGHQRPDIRLRTSIDLPNTEHRYKVFLESDPREGNSLENRTRAVSQGDQLNRSSSVLGLQFSKPRRDPSKWRTDLSLGARFRKGIKPLVRGRLRKYIDLGENWRSYFRQDVWHLEGVGWGETSRWELSRPLGDRFHFRWMAELEYRDEADPLAYANTYRLYQNVSEDLEVVYTYGFLGEGSESDMRDDRFANVSFRYRLYQNWIFIDFTPEYFFRDVDDHEGELSYTINLRVWFTDRR